MSRIWLSLSRFPSGGRIHRVAFPCNELLAPAIPGHSPRATAPFIALNMAAIPKDLIESELFG
ncbi:sigma 54-interacting transcriptional regulator, partial [Escherichia coli]|uniref:sigma 54-interacting transcriptional regulator n=1 Tax=Escherichia coli TaxID=562 RepID=UPI0024E12609